MSAPRGRLDGKAALITGASRNIGRATALAFAQEGCDVALNASESVDELEDVAAHCRTHGVQAITVAGDLANPDTAQDVATRSLERFGRVDVLVSNAAIRPHKPIAETTVREWRRTMGINLDASFFLARALAPQMMERGNGSIVAIAMTNIHPWSAAGPPFLMSASKMGLMGLVRGLAVELGPRGVRVNAVGPGPIDTERRHPEWYPAMQQGTISGDDFLQQVPLRRLGRPEEVAATILFLASDEASYITGAWLPCSGGWYM
jgi:3-oxoacyl-[acyl-carrier protein] reductase